MRRNSYHVMYSFDGGWQVKRGGALRASKIFGVKLDAVKFGRQLSLVNSGELVIHGKDGAVQNVNSFAKGSKD